MSSFLKSFAIIGMLASFYSCQHRALEIVGPYADESNWIYYDVKVIDFACRDQYMKVAIYTPGYFAYTDTAWCMNVAGEAHKVGDKFIGHFVKVLGKDRLTCNGIMYPNQILMANALKRPE